MIGSRLEVKVEDLKVISRKWLEPCNPETQTSFFAADLTKLTAHFACRIIFAACYFLLSKFVKAYNYTMLAEPD